MEDGGEEEALRLGRRAGKYGDQTGDVGEEGLGGLGVIPERKTRTVSRDNSRASRQHKFPVKLSSGTIPLPKSSLPQSMKKKGTQ